MDLINLLYDITKLVFVSDYDSIRQILHQLSNEQIMMIDKESSFFSEELYYDHETVKLLLEKGANPNYCHGNVLYMYMNNINTIKLFMENPIIENIPSIGKDLIIFQCLYNLRNFKYNNIQNSINRDILQYLVKQSNKFENYVDPVYDNKNDYYKDNNSFMIECVKLSILYGLDLEWFLKSEYFYRNIILKHLYHPDDRDLLKKEDFNPLLFEYKNNKSNLLRILQNKYYPRGQYDIFTIMVLLSDNYLKIKQ